MKKTRLFAAVSVIALAFGTSSIAQDVAFSLTNDGDTTMVDLRLSGSSDPSWGEDVLPANIEPGDTLNVTIDELDECEYDLKAVYDDGDTEEVFNVDLCAADDLTIEDDDEDEEEDEDEEDEDEDEEEDEDEDEEDEEDEEEDEDEDEEDDEDEDEEYDDEEEDEDEEEEEEEEDEDEEDEE
ncbi:hypothetical protein KOAAANKH_01356 [Brevundimonas sp. NIBR10]|uniref:hypothetical protein n=1 Tax=Brevundimonas sp. NIBR10 TaxID=3015997 RepID=UPI0022F17456|nr:hypothetical protein [Brevundimonas sp. NIBR10]WGM46487.1 hypothetical protein KOAAANKH_01356 [Brevundimonas sp. NIBR10]